MTVCNFNHFKSGPGILQIIEIAIGAICVGLSLNYYINWLYNVPGQIMFVMMSIAFLIQTFIILISSLVIFNQERMVYETIFEFIYHIFAAILYAIASAVLIIEIDHITLSIEFYNGLMAAGVLGGVQTLLYIASSVFSFRSWKSAL